MELAGVGASSIVQVLKEHFRESREVIEVYVVPGIRDGMESGIREMVFKNFTILGQDVIGVLSFDDQRSAMIADFSTQGIGGNLRKGLQ